MLSPDAQQLWNWISSNVMDTAKTHWCTAGTNSGPTYGLIVNEPIAEEVVQSCFGGYGDENAIEFYFQGTLCALYAVPPVQKPDKVRGWTMNFWLRYPGPSWGTLRVNLHVHLRMAERMKAVPNDDGFTPVKNKKKKVSRTYQ
ncbi:MAG: hypothetical protein ACJ8G7_01975 [Rhizobacter sp.]